MGFPIDYFIIFPSLSFFYISTSQRTPPYMECHYDNVG